MVAARLGLGAALAQREYALDYFRLDPNVGRLRARTAFLEGDVDTPSAAWSLAAQLDAATLGTLLGVAALKRLYLPTKATPPEG